MRWVVRRVQHVRRWIRIGRGPLVRATDRAEMVARLFLLLAIVSATPVGALTGAAVHRSASAVAAQEARTRHPVQVTVLTDPRVRNPAAPGAVETATVAWTDGDRPQTAEVTVGPVVAKNDHIPIWLTSDGSVTGPPPTAAATSADAVGAGLLAGLGTVVGSWLLFGLARGVLDARRLRRWETDWLRVERVWTASTR